MTYAFVILMQLGIVLAALWVCRSEEFEETSKLQVSAYALIAISAFYIVVASGWIILGQTSPYSLTPLWIIGTVGIVLGLALIGVRSSWRRANYVVDEHLSTLNGTPCSERSGFSQQPVRRIQSRRDNRRQTPTNY